MVNFVREGKSILLVALGTITKSKFVVVGDRALVATATVGTGENVEMLCEGVVRYTVLNSLTIANGTKLYWDAGADKLTSVSSGNKPAGWAAEAVVSASEIDCKLGAW